MKDTISAMKGGVLDNKIDCRNGSLDHLRSGSEVDARFVGRSCQHMRLARALPAVRQHACIAAVHHTRNQAPHLTKYLLLTLRRAAHNWCHGQCTASV